MIVDYYVDWNLENLQKICSALKQAFNQTVYVIPSFIFETQSLIF